jgi:hypothetical protein
MHRITPILIIGTIAASSIVTLFVGSQLQNGQCAEFSLPLNIQFSLGKTCGTSRQDNRQTSRQTSHQASHQASH